jgi:hypothetical protein
VCGSDHHRWCVAGTQAGPEKWMAQEEEVEQRTEPVAERSRTATDHVRNMAAARRGRVLDLTRDVRVVH